jgi:hypothetical protein
MGDVTNLRQARKARARAAAEVKAAENRALHGRSQAGKAADRQRQTVARKTLDAAKLER